MKTHLIKVLGLGVVALFLASTMVDVAFGRGGGGGGRGGGGRSFGGGGERSFSGSHFEGSGANRSFNTPHTDFNRGSNTFNHSWNGANSLHTFNGGPGHPGWAGDHHANNWYHGNWHDQHHWDHPWNYGPAAWWGVGFGTGLALGAPWSWGYWPYYNPYCGGPVVLGSTTVDYSQPIASVAPPSGEAADDDQESNDLDDARNAFIQGDYAAAMTEVNQAIAADPNSTLPHEFRALVLFAQKKYKESAAAIYAVLSVGPGWDWATLSGFYPDVNVYTEQLRALEKYRDANPKLPEAHFLLAYHYMTCGHLDAAVKELKEVVKLSPKDQLSAQILAALTQDKTGVKAVPSATPPAPAAPAKPVNAASLVGNWAASRSDGSTFALNLDKMGAYSWTYTSQGKAHTFSGAYTVADNVLILKEGGEPKMVGQIIPVSDTQFTFKLAGDNPSDPGLTFTKK
jgi:Flp pilus assembly protein TadD